MMVQRYIRSTGSYGSTGPKCYRNTLRMVRIFMLPIWFIWFYWSKVLQKHITNGSGTKKLTDFHVTHMVHMVLLVQNATETHYEPYNERFFMVPYFFGSTFESPQAPQQ